MPASTPDDALFATLPGRSTPGHALARPGWGTPAWAGAGASVAVGRFTLNSPFVFVGRNLPTRWAAAIDLSLPCGPEGLAGRPGARTYAQLTARQRHQFLAWLAAGRNAAPGDETPLWVFLSGAEEYLLAARSAETDSVHIEALLAELQRLAMRYRSVYGSVADQFQALHDYFRLARVEASGARAYADTGYVQPAGMSPATGLRFALGHLREDGKKVPARWAYQWARCLLTRSDVSDLAYSEEPLRRLFIQKYVQSFGEGFEMPPADEAQLELSYVPSNPTLPACRLKNGAATVSYWPHLTQPLAVLLAQCFDELRPYIATRRLGTSEDESWPQLPVSLWPDEHRLAFRGVVQQAHEAPTPVTYELLAPYLRLQGSASKKTFSQMKARLAEFGLDAYPDLEGSRRPKGADDIFVLMAGSDEAAPADPLEAAYDVAVRLCLGELPPSEALNDALQAALGQHATADSKLTRSQRLARRAHLAWLVAEPGKKVTKAAWSKLEPEFRSQVLGLLRSLVGGREIASALKGLDRILGADWQATPAAGLSLDVAKVSRLTEETARVQALLGTVFAEPAAPAPVLETPSASSAASPRPSRVAFLRALAERTTWPTAEFDALARAHRLLPGAVLEWANEQAFDRFDAPLLEETSDGWLLDAALLAELLTQDLPE